MAKPQEASERWIHSRIGYEREDEQVEFWNPETQDFETNFLPTGRTSPFALDVQSGLVAFQLRSGDIRPQTFVGAFQALLRKADRTMGWQVQHLFHGIDWTQFVSQVRLVELRIRLERPNPRYPGERVERFVEDTGAYVINMAAHVPLDHPGELDPSEQLWQEDIEHADQGYGDYSATGETLLGRARRIVRWRSKERGVPLESSASTDPVTSEVPCEYLQQATEEAHREIPYFNEEAEDKGARTIEESDEDGGYKRSLNPRKPPPTTGSWDDFETEEHAGSEESRSETDVDEGSGSGQLFDSDGSGS
jgi:hypothetical protein